MGSLAPAVVPAPLDALVLVVTTGEVVLLPARAITSTIVEPPTPADFEKLVMIVPVPPAPAGVVR